MDATRITLGHSWSLTWILHLQMFAIARIRCQVGRYLHDVDVSRTAARREALFDFCRSVNLQRRRSPLVIVVIVLSNGRHCVNTCATIYSQTNSVVLHSRPSMAHARLNSTECVIHRNWVVWQWLAISQTCATDNDDCITPQFKWFVGGNRQMAKWWLV